MQIFSRKILANGSACAAGSGDKCRRLRRARRIVFRNNPKQRARHQRKMKKRGRDKTRTADFSPKRRKRARRTFPRGNAESRRMHRRRRRLCGNAVPARIRRGGHGNDNRHRHGNGNDSDRHDDDLRRRIRRRIGRIPARLRSCGNARRERNRRFGVFRRHRGVSRFLECEKKICALRERGYFRRFLRKRRKRISFSTTSAANASRKISVSASALSAGTPRGNASTARG